MQSSAVDDVVAQAAELASAGVSADQAAEALMRTAGDHREAVVGARDRLAARVHAQVDDFEATATLQLLNRVLGRVPIIDPLDWRVRWTQRFRRP
ncbi:MAG TPA: hypothetical protein VG435_08865 [Acidimicrobiales bacterium]|jgi:hypothetical protein|nr:hypothetical protein [Acidimicrobiales bacterium]